MNSSVAITAPVLVTVGELRFQLERAMLDIARALRKDTQPGRLSPGLSNGDAGLAVLFAAVHQHLPGEGWGERARAHWDAAAEGIAAGPSPPTLFGGFPGVAWAAGQIRDAVLPDCGPGFFDEIDDVLAAVLAREAWPADYDLISGIVGCGVYLLDRLPDRRAAAALERVVHHLERRAVAKGDGITWRTPPETLAEWQREIAPNGYFNLGLAHGVPGVIALLGRMVAVNAGGPGVVPLLEGAVRWTLGQEIAGARGVRYPAWVDAAPRAELAPPSRVAWCYGDLGVSAALVLAAASARRGDWMQAGLRLARRIAALAFEDTGVLDTGICHGSAGVAHLFHRLARNSGDWVLADASRHWLRRTLAMRRQDGIAGFPANRQNPEGSRYWAPEPGLLEGAAGVALVLLAAISERSPDWDRFLLISGPRRGAA